MQRKRLVRHGLLIFALAFIHHTALTFAIMVSFGETMSRFDTGADETMPEHFARRIADLLAFPSGNVTDHFGLVYLGRWVDLIWFSSSVLWALCFYTFTLGTIAVLRRRRGPCVKTHG